MKRSTTYKALIFLTSVVGIDAVRADTRFIDRLLLAAEHRTKQTIRYDGSYLKIDYPLGDVPANIGVCTDVIIRSYRQLGIDLQQLVHEDMQAAFSSYPKFWGLSRPDPNIDHRRVPNLQTFFARHGQTLPITEHNEYQPGDLVTWRLANGRPHIGIVAAVMGDSGDWEVIHNIGFGPNRDDSLRLFEITGHYRFQPQGE